MLLMVCILYAKLLASFRAIIAVIFLCSGEDGLLYFLFLRHQLCISLAQTLGDGQFGICLSDLDKKEES